MTTLRTALTLTAATAGLAVCAAPAGAWTAVNTGTFDTLTLTAAAGELNAPSVEQISPVTMRITDPNGTPTASATCTPSVENHFLQCDFAERVVFNLGDRNDVNLTGDAVTGGLQRLDLNGQTGNDRISNQKLSGTLNGGSGTDVIRPGLGADVITGGSGVDAVDYSERTKPVRINFFGVDGSTEQGEQGEGDSFSGDDVEVAFGGKAGDVLIGNGNDEQFIPGPGADTVEARQGDDVADLRDDTKDTITCGPGADTVYADLKDAVAADCETVSRTSSAPPVSGGEQPAPPTFEAFPVDPGSSPESQDPGTGTGGSGGPAPGADPGAPGQSAAPVANTVRPAIRLAHLTKRSIRRRTGKTTLKFTVTERVALSVKIEKLVGKKRKRAVRMKTLKVAAVDGITSVRVAPKLGVGRYRLTLTARDAAGNTSAPVKLALRVTRR